MGFRAWGQADLPGGGPGDPEKNRFLGGSGPKRHRGARVGARRPGFLSRRAGAGPCKGGPEWAVAGLRQQKRGQTDPDRGQTGPVLVSGAGPGPCKIQTLRQQISVKDLSPSSSGSSHHTHILFMNICCLSVLEGYKVWGKCCGGGTCGPDRD